MHFSATAAKSSPKKRIRAVSNFIAPIPTLSICQMLANEDESDGKEMYKKVCCTCKVVVLLNKSIAYLPFSLPSPSSLRTFPNIACETVSKASVKTKITAEVVTPNQR